MKFVTFFCCLFLMLNCTPALKTIQYNDRAAEALVTGTMDTVFNKTIPLKVVLRVPQEERSGNSILYNEMEKQLLKSGFTVRDRKLFNEVFNKSNVQDYRQIREFTDTDIILEVLDITPDIVYSTHQVTLAYKRKQKFETQDIEYLKYGAQVNYRIILVNRNDIAAQFQFHYKPCAAGCDLESFTISRKNEHQTELKEIVSPEEMKNFVAQSIKEMLVKLNL